MALDGSSATLSHAALRTLALRYARGLRDALAGCSGSPEIVVLDADPLTFVALFVASLAVGGVPVPAPGHAAKNPRHLSRLRSIIGVSVPTAVIGASASVASARSALPEAKVLWLEADQILGDSPLEDYATSHRAAYVQYTSGSVYAPKPIVVLAENVRAHARQAAAVYAEERERLSQLGATFSRHGPRDERDPAFVVGLHIRHPRPLRFCEPTALLA